MATKEFAKWRKKVFEIKDIDPFKLGKTTQENIIAEFGQPDMVSTIKKNGRPLIFKYDDIEFHFDRQNEFVLYLVYSDEAEELCIIKQEFPSLTKNQVALARADFMTGHVYDKNFNLYSNSKGGEVYSTFDSLDLAKQYIAEQKVIHKNIEFWVYGKSQEEILYIKPD